MSSVKFLLNNSTTSASTDHCDIFAMSALPQNPETANEASSLRSLEEVTICSTDQRAAPPRFESLPPEMRNMIYGYLLAPVQLQHFPRNRLVSGPRSRGHFYSSTYVLPTANTAILRTNCNINNEASAVFYRDLLLVLIDWEPSGYRGIDGVSRIFRQGTPLPPYVVHVQQQFHDENASTARTSIIVAAANFPAVCRQFLFNDWLYMKRARTSYSVMSLPRMGYDVEKLREQIWSPLLTLQNACCGDFWGRHQCNLKAVDCTGVFEQTAAALDWDSESDDEDSTDLEDESEETDNDDDGSKIDTTSEEESDYGDSDEGESGEEETDRDEDGNEEDSSDENSNEDGLSNKGDCQNANAEDMSDEATSNEKRTNDPGEKMSLGGASPSGHEGDAIAHIVVEHDRVARARMDDRSCHEVSIDDGLNGKVNGIMDKRDIEEH